MSDEKNSSLRDLATVPSPIFRPTRDLLTLETGPGRVERVAKVIAPAISGVPAHLVLGGPAAGAAAPPKYRQLALGNNDLSDTLISAPTAGQILKYSGGKWINGASASGAAGGAMAVFPHVQGGAAASWQNTTFNLLVPSTEILTYGTKIKLVWKSTTNTFIVGAAVVRRTTPGSTTFVDSTPITWGGINPTFTGTPITQISDEITVTIDVNHDYYFQIYVTNASSASAQLITQDLSGAFAGLTGGTKSGNNTAGAYSGYANGTTLFGIQMVQVTG